MTWADRARTPARSRELWVVDVGGSIVIMDGVYYPDTMPNAVDDVEPSVRLRAGRGVPTSRTLVVKFTLQPGAQFPWHTHPGPVIVTVQQGTLIYTLASDCIDRSYPAGTAFVDPGHGTVHTAHNPSDLTETILYATFLDFPAAGELSIPDADQHHCGT